jgi:Skp family chaperone for outer membrane proteins
MFFGLLTLLTALAISTVAAWYSIIGLMAIFAGATTAIMIMGIVLEIGKLICASWTFTNWKKCHVIMKTYFILAVVVLMLITSLGIFGFLSRAHITQSSPTSLMEERIERIELKVNQRQTQIKRYQGRLDTLDDALQKYIELGAISKGLAKIGAMDNETNLLKTKIEGLESEIDGLTDKKYELKTELNLAEVEVGPIRYVASMIYDDVSESQLEEAVRWIIILLIFVFDPLAVVLVIAANISLRDYRKERKMATRTVTVMPDLSDKEVIDKENVSKYSDDEGNDFKILTWEMFKKLGGKK